MKDLARLRIPITIGMLVFLLLIVLTQYLAYQSYLMEKNEIKEAVSQEISSINFKLRNAISHNQSAAKTLAFIVEKYGIPEDFNAVGKEILQANKYVDAVELTRKGVITHVYPLEKNSAALGFDILADSLSNREAIKALKFRYLYFAGPLKLRQGGLGIVGRLPVFIDNSFWGFSIVIIRLSTFLEAAGIDSLNHDPRFEYQLSKINPNTSKEEFFFPGTEIKKNSNAAVLDVPDGSWKIYVIPKEEHLDFSNIIFLSLLGVVLSFVCGLFAYYLAKQPANLNMLIEEKTLKLSSSENYYRSLIEKSFDAIVLFSKRGKILYQSPAAARISGYSPEELSSMYPMDLIHPDDKEENIAIFKKLLAFPGLTINYVHRFRKKDNTYIWLEGTYTNLLNDFNIEAIVCNCQDITARKISEDVNTEVTKDLVQRNNDLQQFAYIISHNLRGPVSNILGLSNILKTNLSEQEIKQTMDYLFKAVGRLDETVKDLNEILQVRSVILENREEVMLPDLLNEILLSLDSVIKQANVRVVSELVVEKIATIKSYINSIFYNLILNSIKYKHPVRDPVISISTRRVGDILVLKFKDNGTGIDLTHSKEKVFGLYQRFHPNIEGKGLGLYMVKTQVQTLGGTISVNSEPDIGTEFIIELPC